MSIWKLTDKSGLLLEEKINASQGTSLEIL